MLSKVPRISIFQMANSHHSLKLLIHCFYDIDYQFQYFRILLTLEISAILQKLSNHEQRAARPFFVFFFGGGGGEGRIYTLF